MNMENFKQFSEWGAIGGRASARTRARRLLKAKNRKPAPKYVKPKKFGKINSIVSERNLAIAKMFLDFPCTLEDVAAKYQITRERVRQILAAQGISSRQGGRAMCLTASLMSEGAEKAKERIARKNKSCHTYMMCDPGAYAEITGHNWISLAFATPLAKAYWGQRRSAGTRNIHWNISFPQWVDVWRASGKIEYRGRGQGKYVMARKLDIGGYDVDNVYICPSVENNSDRNDKRSGLPMGVTFRRNKYIAQKMIDGKNYNLGSHATPEEASAAYQKFTGKKE